MGDGSEPRVADAGVGFVRSSWIGTGVMIVAAAAAAAFKGARLAVVIIDLGLFFGGCVAFLWALATAAGRSREREISLWNLFLLEGVAPRRVRSALLAALAIEVAVALSTAWIASALAFGCLAPMWALGHCGLWAARYGTFGPRPAAPGRRQPKAKR